jgi:hypothetical protein
VLRGRLVCGNLVSDHDASVGIMHGFGESESISTGALKEGMGPFVRQDELSMQGVYVKVLWLTMVR